MNAPTATIIWQAFAQGRATVLAKFAMQAFARHCNRASYRHYSDGFSGYKCTPSLRSGPSQAGPTFPVGHSNANCGSRRKFCYESRSFAVESGAITTTQRGSLPCASRLSSSPFFPRRSPAACRTPRRAGLQVLPRARLSQMPPKVTFSPGPSSAVLPAPHPAGSSWVCRPVTRATRPAALGQTEPLPRTIRASRPGGPFHFART